MHYGLAGHCEMPLPSLMPIKTDDFLAGMHSHPIDYQMQERYRSSVSVSENSECSDASNEPTTLSDIADIVQELNDDPSLIPNIGMFSQLLQFSHFFAFD